MRRRVLLPITISMIALAVTASSLAEEEQDEYAVKAAYLYNFCNYVKWPRQVNENTITVGVIGPALAIADVATAIRELNGQSVANKKIVVLEFGSVDKYRPCDLLFVTGASPGNPDVLAKLAEINAGKSVLIVSETPDGLKRGATINFVPVGKAIKFEIRRSAAQKANLTINAKLLRLAVNSEAD